MVQFTEEAGIVPTSPAKRLSAATSTTSALSTCSSACSSGTRTRWSRGCASTGWT